VVARRERDDTLLPLFGRQLQQAVGRAPELECAACLQALAFEPDSDASDRAFDQRGALDQTVNSRGGIKDVAAGDLTLVR
jgi:hypothetical protein